MGFELVIKNIGLGGFAAILSHFITTPPLYNIKIKYYFHLILSIYHYNFISHSYHPYPILLIILYK